jgi:hypothetical protein
LSKSRGRRSITGAVSIDAFILPSFHDVVGAEWYH